MSALQTEIFNAKKFLKSQNINVLDEWLEGCIEFFHTSGKSYSSQELNYMVKSQWLLSDLKEICPGCLPPNLNNSAKTQLIGIYTLQMNFVVDVGVPAYQQLQKLTKVDTTNIDVTIDATQSNNFPEPSAQRMLKLSLTDGIQEISGIEYRPMRNLTCDLTPGTKIQIKGPVDCRRGVLMLEEKHLTVLGGEVEDIIINNLYRNVLTRIVSKNSEITSGKSLPDSMFTRNLYQPSRNEINRNPNNPNTVPNQNRFQRNVSSENTRSGMSSGANMFIDDEIKDLDAGMFADDDFDVDQLAAIEQQAFNASASNSSESPKFAVKKMKISNDAGQFVVEKLSPQENKREPTATTTGHAGSFELDEEDEYLRMAEMYDLTDHYNEPEMENGNFTRTIVGSDNKEKSIQYFPKPEHRKFPVELRKQPFVYLKQLAEVPSEKLEGKIFTIKAQIFSLKSKLAHKNGEWDLKCKLTDGTAYLVVSVAGDILTQLVGYTTSDVARMKAEFESNPQVKQKVLQGISDAREKLQKMYCLLDITYRDTGPWVVSMTEYKFGHLLQLKERLAVAGYN